MLQLVNYINQNGMGRLPTGLPVAPYLDVNGDGFLAPDDVLAVINYINNNPYFGSGGSGAEGEDRSSNDMWIPASHGVQALFSKCSVTKATANLLPPHRRIRMSRQTRWIATWAMIGTQQWGDGFGRRVGLDQPLLSIPRRRTPIMKWI